ncbi:MAG: DUF2207 domain-containing protein [Hyphomicrobiales bacterium]
MMRIYDKRLCKQSGFLALCFLMLFGLSLGLSANSHAQSSQGEVITNFHADIEVQQNGDLIVTETISVIAKQQKIKRGIFRDFPRTFIDDKGATQKVGFKILSIIRDGEPDSYHHKWSPSWVRTYIGKEDYYLKPGAHTYEIKYWTDRQIRFFNEHDELYWNVTGNGWDFPIDTASASVRVVEGGLITDVNFFTGPAGSTDQNADARVSADQRSANFSATTKLARYEGLTIVAKLVKGTVDAPSGKQNFSWFMRDFGHIVVAVLTLFVISIYYLLTWFRIGRDPSGHTVVPRWDLPDGMSPALVNYIDKKGLDDDAMAAAILSLAIKGLVIIDNAGKKLHIIKTDAKPAEALPTGENAIYKKLDANEVFKFTKSNGTSVAGLRKAFRDALESEHRGVYYKHNSLWVALGVVLSIAGLVATMIYNSLGIALLVPLIPTTIVGFAIMGPILSTVRNLKRNDGLATKLLSVIKVGFIIALAFGLIGSFISKFVAIFEDSDLSIFIGVVSTIAAVNGLFYFLLGAPTKIGAKKNAEVEGLRTYLKYAEEDRMNRRDAPEMSPQLFEKLLPYAVALNVEKPWSQAFDTWLASAATGSIGSTYQPHWSSRRYRHGNISDGFGNIGNSIASSISSSMPKPKSSSSGFSGGSSGGGGGGGGGGGW